MSEASAADLSRRIGRAIERGRGMQLTGADLDMLAVSGALGVLSQHASAELRTLAERRTAERASRK